MLSLGDTLSVLGFFLEIPRPPGRSTMAGFLCIRGKGSLAAVLPLSNGSLLLTWADKTPMSPGVSEGLSLGK